MNDASYIYKVCVVGNGGVGKTSAVRRYSEGVFTEEYQVTVGVQHSTQTIQIDGSDGLTNVKIICWDLGGQDKFKFVRPMFYRSARGLVLMFDVTSRASFEALPKWIKEAEDGIGSGVPMVLAANKFDLPDHEVSLDELQEFAQQIGAEYVVTSVKTGDNVNNMFKMLGTVVYEARTLEVATSSANSSVRRAAI
ncbi:MAG: GTP-binding protein [Candidatus Thorarchaeota archaeon]|nr:GTP-binding protein [Candidatus Thorarchaeota archaeon]